MSLSSSGAKKTEFWRRGEELISSGRIWGKTRGYKVYGDIYKEGIMSAG
jgi:hypothetical protein